MRNLRRGSREEEEEESVFVPMTDMTVSFLFIVMILLAFFAVRFSDTDSVPRSEYDVVVEERSALEVERDALRVELDRLRARNATLEFENAELRREKNALNDLIRTLQAENTRLNDENLELLARNQELLQENANLTDQIALRDLEIERLQERILELEERLREQNPLEQYIVSAQARRLEILREIERALKIEFQDDILVEISPENDALRFTGEGLFQSGSRSLLPAKRLVVARLAQLITDAIDCYTVNERSVVYSECNPDGIIIEAIQIEGHTDAEGTDEYNIGLSTDRANNAFLTMLNSQEDLLSFLNIRGQPVISVAGYGEMRPIASNDTMIGRAENRRIDLRLIMYTPRDREQVERIQQQIREGLSLVVEGRAADGP